MTELAGPVGTPRATGDEQVAPSPSQVNGNFGVEPIVLQWPAGLRLDEEQFLTLCQANEAHRFERGAEGNLIIMPSTAGGSGNRNFRLIGQFYAWVEQDGSGEGFDSSTLFRLPNGKERSPDLSWVRRERLIALQADEKEKVYCLCPDFVVELRSPSDSLKVLQEKMEEYLENGARLGWLLDPAGRQAFVYRPGQATQQLAAPATLAGDPELPGFALEMDALFHLRY